MLQDLRYLRSSIYLLTNNFNPEQKYVGSSIEPLNIRYSKHKHDCKNYKNKVCFYKDTNDFASEWTMTLYEKYPCANKRELEAREYEIIQHLNTVNKRRSQRS